jgi:prophage DNA circulation protein
MPAFDSAQRASFNGIAFPVKTISIKGKYRHADHEYLRVPGAVIEKLERSVYSIEMQAVFDTNIRGYGQLWPNGVQALRALYEAGTTGPLVVPTIGTLPAFQPDWDQNIEIAKVRSGETIKLSFKEDQTQKFLQLALVQTQQQSLATTTGNLATVLASLNPPPEDQSLFDGIVSSANSILAIKDQADLYGGLLSVKLQTLTSLFDQADKQLESLKDPANFEALDAFLEMWNAAVRMATNLADSPRGPRSYTTPRQMSVSDIATAIYGSSERAPEIMMNNRFSDPFAVPAGEKVIYFEDAGLLAA